MHLVKDKNRSELVENENNIAGYIRKSSKWTSKEDTLLIQTLIQYLRDGKTEEEAFRSLQGAIKHNYYACKHRLLHVLQYLYVKELSIAKQEGKALRRLLEQVGERERLSYPTIAEVMN